MNRTTILKGLAICSSILLAGGFVVYRQKQATDPRNEEEPIMPGSKNPNRPVVFPSSKNIDAVLGNPHNPKSTPINGIPADPEAFRSRSDSRDGSDFISPLLPEDQPSEKKKDPTLLPSSKGLSPGLGPGGNDTPINRETIERILGERKESGEEEAKKPEEKP